MEFVWPDRLPCPSVDFEYAPNSPFIRTQMDYGARHRPRFKRFSERFRVNYLIKRNDMKDFRYFVYEIIGKQNYWGWFQTPLMVDDELKMMRARFVNANQPFTVINKGNVIWEVSAELECFELNLISELDYFDRNIDQLALTDEWRPFADYIRDRNILDLALNKEWPEQ